VIEVDQYQLIRQLYVVEGFSQREIARTLGVSRNTVKRYCLGENVPWERKTPVNAANPVITPEVIAFVQQCLDEDHAAKVFKQKHSAKRIYDRLKAEANFKGGESTIRHLVSEMKAIPYQVYVPLSFAPGEAAQVDWGTAKVIMQGKKIDVNLFCMRLCFSCAPFVMAYPSQREEVFLEGHEQAFNFIGGVNRTLIYDNLKTAVKEGWGKLAREQDKFKAFRAHYTYQTSFCNPGEGHEKGLVENLVGYIRRNVLVPLPRVESYEELNQLLQKRCIEYINNHQIRGKDLSVKESFEMERRALIPLPLRPYETAKTSEVKVDYYATIVLDSNHYSVPVQYAGYTVTIKASAFKVKVYWRGNEIAIHSRVYQKHRTIYQLEHYIPLLERRPRSVFHARPVKQANLPQLFFDYAARLKDPEKGMVRLLRMLIDYGSERVHLAVRKAWDEQQYSVDVVHCYVTDEKKTEPLLIPGPVVQAVDLHAYDILAAGGGLS
jgi:transposase